MLGQLFITDILPANVATGQYVPLLVFASYVVASLGAFTGLTLASYIFHAPGVREKRMLHWAGAFALGSGIWSMHFIGMLAYDMDMVHEYDPLMTVQSTPFFSRDGRLLGMLSTHFKQQRLPDEKYLHTLDLYVLQAAHVMEMTRAKTAPKDNPPTVARSSRHSPAAGNDNKQLALRMIETLPFFADLTDTQKAELLEVARLKHFQRGEMIFRIGDPVTHLKWVCVGAVQKYRETQDGQEITTAIRIIGDVLFDLDSTSGKRVRSTNARALHSTTLLTVPVGWIDAHLGNWDHLARKFVTVMAQREWEAQLETEHRDTFTAAQIVACFLQHLCVTHHLDPRGFILPYSKSVIASRLGMQRESLSRVLPKLREYGIIVRGKQVSFTDIGTAQAFSCGHCSVEEECPTHQAMQRLAAATPARKKLEVAN